MKAAFATHGLDLRLSESAGEAAPELTLVVHQRWTDALVASLAPWVTAGDAGARRDPGGAVP